MRPAVFALSAALVLPCDPLAAAKRILTWEDATGCLNTIEFDDAKYQDSALRNTIKVLFDPLTLPFIQAPAPEDMAKLDLDPLTAQCTTALAHYEGLSLIPLPGIRDYWRAKVEQIRDGCAFGMAEIRGYRDPAALREYQPAAAPCSRYVDALEGKIDISQVWRDLITEACRGNTDPAKCTSFGLAFGSRPNGVRWFVHSYGWNICATKFMKINSPKDAAARLEIAQRFKRLFKMKRMNCDDDAD
jgi:hypothetical protein